MNKLLIKCEQTVKEKRRAKMTLAKMAIFNKRAISVTMVCPETAINMVNIGVYAKNRKNVDNL